MKGVAQEHGESREGVPVLLGVVGILTALAVCLYWGVHLHYGTNWDESLYLDRVSRDMYVFRHDGLLRVLREIARTDVARPPGYRLGALLFTPIFGAAPPALRALSLFTFGCTLTVLYMAVRSLGRGETAAMTTTALFGLSYGPVWAAAHFGTEYVLYMALASLVFFSSKLVSPAPVHWSSFVGLAASVTAGALSKVTFFAVSVPYLATLAAWLAWTGLRRRGAGVIAAALAGLAAAGPWWLRNNGPAWAFARQSSRFSRHHFALGAELFWNLLGPLNALLAVGALVLAIGVVRRRLQSGAPRGLATSCVVGAIPITVTQVFSPNHNSRLLTPALLLLAIAVGTTLPTWEWRALPRIAKSILVLAVAGQAAYVGGKLVSSHVDQWDWEQLKALCLQRELTNPRVAYLGHGTSWNPPAMEYPWAQEGQDVSVEWLWRFENGPLVWADVEERIKAADVVVTAVGYLGDPVDQQPLDNAHNAELVEKLRDSRLFQAPVELRMGAERQLLLVYFRQSAKDS